MRLMVDASAIGVPSKLAFEWRGGVDGLAEEVAGKVARACDSLELPSSCSRLHTVITRRIKHEIFISTKL